jgi:hypothetical protein
VVAAEKKALKMFYAPVLGQDDFTGLADLGKAVPRPTSTAQATAYKAKLAVVLAARKAKRCTTAQTQVLKSFATQTARLSTIKNAKIKARRMARISAVFTRKRAALQKRCTVSVAPAVAAVPLSVILPLPAACQAGDPTCDPNTALIDQADYAGALQDWQDCMSGEQTCGTDDCGPSANDLSVCDTHANFCNPNYPGCDQDYQACVQSYNQCMAADNASAGPGATVCQAGVCGMKPISQRMSGLGVFEQSSLLWIGGIALVLWCLSRKAKR